MKPASQTKTTAQIINAGIARQMNILRCQQELFWTLHNFRMGKIEAPKPICNVRAVLMWRESQAEKVGNFLIYNN